MRRSCSGALQRPCTPPAPPNRPGTKWPPQPSPARSAQENPDVSAHPRGRRDPKRRRGTHRSPAPPAPAGDESQGTGAARMLTSTAGNGPHSQVILLCDTLRGTVRIVSNAHCPGETGPCRVAGCGDPGRSKPGGPTPAGYSRSPFVPVPTPPIGCLLHDEHDGGEGHAGNTANRITCLSFTTTPATRPSDGARHTWPTITTTATRPHRTGAKIEVRTVSASGLAAGNASLKRLQRGRLRADRCEDRPDRGFTDDSCPLRGEGRQRYRRLLNSSPEGLGHGERHVPEMRRPAEAGPYCSLCAVDVMAKALNPFHGGRRKKLPGQHGKLPSRPAQTSPKPSAQPPLFSP